MWTDFAAKTFLLWLASMMSPLYFHEFKKLWHAFYLSFGYSDSIYLSPSMITGRIDKCETEILDLIVVLAFVFLACAYVVSSSCGCELVLACVWRRQGRS